MARDISYGELNALEVEFDKQCEFRRIEWIDSEVREECLLDFISQYEEGDDDPQINLNGYGYH